MIYGTESLYISLAIIGKYSNKSGNVRQFCYHLVGISEYIICLEERRGKERRKHARHICWCSASNSAGLLVALLPCCWNGLQHICSYVLKLQRFAAFLCFYIRLCWIFGYFGLPRGQNKQGDVFPLSSEELWLTCFTVSPSFDTAVPLKKWTLVNFQNLISNENNSFSPGREIPLGFWFVKLPYVCSSVQGSVI